MSGRNKWEIGVAIDSYNVLKSCKGKKETRRVNETVKQGHKYTHRRQNPPKEWRYRISYKHIKRAQTPDKRQESQKNNKHKHLEQ